MNKLKNTMMELGYSPRKEIIRYIFILTVLIFVGIGIFFLTKNIVLPLFLFPVIFLFSILYFTRFGKMKDKKDAMNIEEFSILFGYFRIYIKNGFSVYSALKEIRMFADDSLRKMLDTLLREIDNDKTVQPFINFSKNFKEIIVKEMMISIYQMVDDGEQSDYLMQFELIFDKFSELIAEKNLKTKDSKLGTITSSPLVGSCFMIIVLAIGIIGIIGELVNGI